MIKMGFRVYVNCEDEIEIVVSDKSKVEVFYDGGCRGEYWGNRGEVWKGLVEIEEGVEFLNNEMEMGESGIWWIKVSGRLVYGSKEDWKNWKEDREWDWKSLKNENGEDDEEVKECRRLLDGLNEKNWLDLEYVGKISDMLSCF